MTPPPDSQPGAGASSPGPHRTEKAQAVEEELARLLSPVSLRGSPKKTRRRLLELRRADLTVEQYRRVDEAALDELAWRLERGLDR
jgi:hypothetical protein